jgi:hypothetical protein
VGHLNDLYAKYKDKGFVLVALTDEARGLVDKFIATTNATHPIVIEGSDTTDAWGVKGFPSSFLVDPDGKIAWAGNPGGLKDSQIEELLTRVRLAPKLPKSLEGVGKEIEKSKYSDALKKLDSAIADGKLSREDTTVAEETRTWLTGKGEGWIASAKAAEGAGDFYEAAKALEMAKDGFKGHDISVQAEAQLKELLADEGRKKEIDGGKALDLARDRAAKMKEKDAAAMFKAIASKFRGTKAGEKAELLAQKYGR